MGVELEASIVVAENVCFVGATARVFVIWKEVRLPDDVDRRFSKEGVSVVDKVIGKCSMG